VTEHNLEFEPWDENEREDGLPEDEEPQDESAAEFISFDDSREMDAESLKGGVDYSTKRPKPPRDEVEEPPEKEESPLSTERKKSSEDFSFDLDFSPEHTRRIPRKKKTERARKKPKPPAKDQPPASDLMTAPLVTESPHGKKRTKQPMPSGKAAEGKEGVRPVPAPPRPRPGEGPPIILPGHPPKPARTGPVTPATPHVPRASAYVSPREATEKKPEVKAGRPISLYGAILLVLFLCLAGLLSFRYICNFDIWWHLSTGSDILVEKSLPGNDPYSFTASDRTVFTPYPMAQVVFAALGRIGDGTTALIVFKTLMILIAFLLCIFAVPGERKISILVLWLGLAALFASNERLLVRPHLMTMVMAPLFFLILERHERIGTKWIWALPAAAVIWANWHPGWIIGVLVVFAFLVGNAIFFFYGISYDERKKEIKRLGWLALILLLVAAAGLITPNHIHGFLHPLRQLTIISDINEGVGEWSSPLKGFTLLSSRLIYWKILVAVGVLSFLANWKRQRLSHLLVFIGVLVLSLTAYRHMAIFALLAAPIAAGNFLSVFSQFDVEKAGRFAALIAGLLFAGVVSYFAVGLTTNDYYRSRKLYGFHTGGGVSSVYLPAEAVKAFRELNIRGNGFHNYHLGGFLMHTLGPGTKVFLDGRLLHYPKAVREDYKTLKGEPDKWFAIAAKPEYKFDWAMLAHTTGEFRALIKMLWKNAEWQPVYTDSVVIMFVRRSGINSELVKKGVPARLLDVSGMEYPEYHYRQLGRLFTDLEQYAQAKQNLRKAQDLPYASPHVEIDLGRVFLLTGEIEKARQMYISVRVKAQYESNLGLGHVDLAMSPPDLKFARRHFEQALQHRPRSVEAHLGLARVAIARDRLLEAERQVEIALEIDPHSAEALELSKKLNIQPE